MTALFLAQSSVRVLKQGRLLSLLRRGNCFGEMAHLSEHAFKRSTDVIARNDVVLIEIDPDCWPLPRPDAVSGSATYFCACW